MSKPFSLLKLSRETLLHIDMYVLLPSTTVRVEGVAIAERGSNLDS